MTDLVKISLYKSVLQTVPKKNIHLRDFYYAVMCGDYEDEIKEIRANPEKSKELKRGLPGVTISGLFRERSAQGLIQHSGRICIDIDGKENPHLSNWPEIRNTLSTWKEIEFTSLSASGNGLMVVVKIEFPEKHLSHYMALEYAFLRQGIRIDPLCKDIPRFRFMTSDKDAIINENVVPYQILFQKANNPRFSEKRDKGTNDDLLMVINEIVNKSIDITESYKNWYQIGCALANEYGEIGRDYYHKLSQINPEYKLHDCDKQYNKCLTNPKGYSKSTIFHYIKQCDTTKTNI